MIKIKLKKEYLNNLFFDALPEGKNQFLSENNEFVADLTEEQYNGFTKDNNVIPYRNSLKLYESGEIIGSFDNTQ